MPHDGVELAVNSLGKLLLCLKKIMILDKTNALKKEFVMLDRLFSLTALAQGANPQQVQPSLLDSLMLPIGMMVILYFFMLRPQQKKVKEHKELIAALKPGDEVVTNGGIIGFIRSVADGFVTVEVASNMHIKVLKNHISGLTKNQPAK